MQVFFLQVFSSVPVWSHRVSLQNRLTMGVFSVSPCTGSLQPGSQQVVTVECVAEQLGSWNQGLLIDISDRDPSDQPDGIPYRLLAEVCKPGENCVIWFCLIWIINLSKAVAGFQMAQFHACQIYEFRTYIRTYIIQVMNLLSKVLIFMITKALTV